MLKYIQSCDYNLGHRVYYNQIPSLTKIIGDTYPCHSKWLEDKFFGGLKCSTERAYVFAVDGNFLAGVNLLKNTNDEKKICCLFVSPKYRNLGIASKLIEKSFDLLQTNKPLITVSSNNIDQLQSLLNKYNFELTRTVRGAYRPEFTEFYFNESR